MCFLQRQEVGHGAHSPAWCLPCVQENRAHAAKPAVAKTSAEERRKQREEAAHRARSKREARRQLRIERVENRQRKREVRECNCTQHNTYLRLRKASCKPHVLSVDGTFRSRPSVLCLAPQNMRRSRRQRSWLEFVAFAARQQALMTVVHQARIKRRAHVMSLAINYAVGKTFYRWKKYTEGLRRTRCRAMLRLWLRRCHRHRRHIRLRRASDLIQKFLTDIATSDIITRGVRKLVGTITRVKLWWLRRCVPTACDAAAGS